MKNLAACLAALALCGCVTHPTGSDPFAATDANDVRALRSYLDQGGDPNAKAAHGESLLYVATGPHGGEEVLRLLLQRGANPNLGAGKYTPLMNASSWCWFEGVTLLIESGADPKAQNEKGETALQTMCMGGDREKLIAYLHDHGL